MIGFNSILSDSLSRAGIHFDPLRRRSLYLRFEHPSIERETRILEKRTAGTHMDLYGQLAGFAHALRGYAPRMLLTGPRRSNGAASDGAQVARKRQCAIWSQRPTFTASWT
jgi:hypothetical protein